MIQRSKGFQVINSIAKMGMFLIVDDTATEQDITAFYLTTIHNVNTTASLTDMFNLKQTQGKIKVLHCMLVVRRDK